MESKQAGADMGSLLKGAVHGMDAKTWAVGMVGLLIVQYLVKKYCTIMGFTKKPTLPPGPPNWPIIGAVLSIDDLGDCFQRLATEYGPISYFRLGSRGVIVVSSEAGAEEVLKTKDEQFTNRPNTTILRSSAKYLGFDAQDIILASYNKNMKLLKKVCIMEFFSSSKLSMYENVRRHEGAAMVEDITRQIETGRAAAGLAGLESSVNVAVREVLTLAGTNQVSTLLFGKRYSDAILSDNDPLRYYRDIVEQFSRLFLKLNVVDFFPWLQWLDPQGLKVQYKEFQQLCKLCYGQILEDTGLRRHPPEDRFYSSIEHVYGDVRLLESLLKDRRQVRRTRKNYEDRDFLDHLLTLREHGRITENALMACIMEMILGGINTNTSTIEWTLLELVKTPDCLAKLQKEIDAVVGRDRQVEDCDFPNMPYLHAVLKESFRLHPAVPLLAPHSNESATTLLGYYVPASTTVFVNYYSIARDPDLWENPEVFNPERFMGPSHVGMSIVTGGNFRLMPFGSGRRMCPAFKLALVTVQRMLTTLVHAFEWSPPLGQGVDDIIKEHRVGERAVSHPDVPLVLSTKPRLSPGVYSTY